MTSLVAQMIKHLPTMQETWVRSLGREDPLKKEMATHSSILAWRIPWTEAVAFFLGFSGGSECKECACIVGDWVLSLSWEDPLERE